MPFRSIHIEKVVTFNILEAHDNYIAEDFYLHFILELPRVPQMSLAALYA